MIVKNHINLLGMKGQDKVMGMKGVISNVSFDLYGRIQCVLSPSANNKGEYVQGTWFDVARIIVPSKKRVMPMPNFGSGYMWLKDVKEWQTNC